MTASKTTDTRSEKRDPPFSPIGIRVQQTWFHAASIAFIVAACLMVGIETNHEFFQANYELLIAIDYFLILGFVIDLGMRYWADVEESRYLSPESKPDDTPEYDPTGKQPRNYTRFFLDPWHIIDIIVIVVCLLPTHTEFFAVLRTLRILRIFLLIDEVPKLKVLVMALVRSVESIAYIILLLVIHFFVYAVIGCDAFGKYSPTHFGSLGQTFLTLFRIVTGDSWSEVMNQLQQADPHPSTVAVVVYFVSFVVIGAMIFINLFTSVLTNEVGETKKEEDERVRREKLLKKSEGKVGISYHDEHEVLMGKIKELTDAVNNLKSKHELEKSR